MMKCEEYKLKDTVKNRQENYIQFNVKSNKYLLRKKIIQKLFVRIFMALLISCSFIYPVMAEGSSAKVFLSLSKDTLNIGKTFTLTLKATPNSNIPIDSFEAIIQYDSSKFELITEGGSPKITKPSGVPSSFLMDVSVTGSQININCNDNSTARNSPIKTNGETSLISFTFKVKDKAALGQASFSIIGDCVINRLVDYSPISIPVEIVSPKVCTVAARLDTNTNLSEIKTDIGTLNPAFSKGVTNYSLEVPTECTAINVTAKAESALSKAVVAGGKTLAYGSNKVTVTVTAQDPDATKVYTITVNRPSPPVSSMEESSISEISESSEESSSEESTDSSSVTDSSSLPTDPTATALQFWKLIAYLFIGLFVATAGVLGWFVYDKVGRKGKNGETVEIKRIK